MAIQRAICLPSRCPSFEVRRDDGRLSEVETTTLALSTLGMSCTRISKGYSGDVAGKVDGAASLDEVARVISKGRPRIYVPPLTAQLLQNPCTSSPKPPKWAIIKGELPCRPVERRYFFSRFRASDVGSMRIVRIALERRGLRVYLARLVKEIGHIG